MCKKLMFLISLVMVLGLATVASADEYEYTGDYPWSYLYISPWNWDPVSPYGGPGLGDKAEISEGGPIVLDTDIAVDRIEGPAWENDANQTMYLIHDCNLFLDDGWRQRGEGGWAYIEMADNAKVFVNDGDFEFEGDEDDDEYEYGSLVVLNMPDNTEITTDDRDFKVAKEPWDYFELNMTDNAYMKIDGKFESDKGEVLLNISGDAVLEAKEC